MELFDALVRYEVALWNRTDRMLTRGGLVSLGQLHALRMIDRHDGQARVQDLAEDIGITVGAVSKLVDRLERDDLVVRNPNPANRRSSLISLTPGGRHALAAAYEAARAAVDEALGDLDVRPTTAALGRLQQRLDSLTAEVAA